MIAKVDKDYRYTEAWSTLSSTQRFVLSMIGADRLVFHSGMLQWKYNTLRHRRVVDGYCPLTEAQLAAYHSLLDLSLVTEV